LMHAPSQGSDPHKGGSYDDVVTDVFDWLEARVDVIEAAGIGRDKILIDPGIGFGKSLPENLSIINNLAMFHAIGCAIVFGGSRKRMIGALSNEAGVEERLGGSLSNKARKSCACTMLPKPFKRSVSGVGCVMGR
jgi:dihydropteroate synthase